MNQYAVLIYSEDSAHLDGATAAETASHDEHAEELVQDGAMLAAYALAPRATAKSIRKTGMVTDGPFVESKEVVAGFYVIEAPDLDTALQIAGTNPVVAGGGGVEVRRVASGGAIGHPS